MFVPQKQNTIVHLRQIIHSCKNNRNEVFTLSLVARLYYETETETVTSSYVAIETSCKTLCICRSFR
ncbi:hypothetical protein HanXRQr2_Chr16g0731081 [Helianthus annuus]|uniref:Uncharacterized protein n=1 Tax=Helianthus annuus TaxID=4232 RepID=A0A9K3DQV1_HELAN|nr:hypothetical protein HanXRQr2_Chr16g0731081 [Helianthus annuus]